MRGRRPSSPEIEYPEDAAYAVPRIGVSILIISCLLKQPATDFLHLIYQHSERIERRENVRQMDASMAVVLLKVVYIPCLQYIECLVRNGLSVAANSHDWHHRVPFKRKLGDP